MEGKPAASGLSKWLLCELSGGRRKGWWEYRQKAGSGSQPLTSTVGCTRTTTSRGHASLVAEGRPPRPLHFEGMCGPGGVRREGREGGPHAHTTRDCGGSASEGDEG